MARDTGCFFWLLCGLRGVLCSTFDSAWCCVLLVQRTANTIHEHKYSDKGCMVSSILFAFL